MAITPAAIATRAPLYRRSTDAMFTLLFPATYSRNTARLGVGLANPEIAPKISSVRVFLVLDAI